MWWFYLQHFVLSPYIIRIVRSVSVRHPAKITFSVVNNADLFTPMTLMWIVRVVPSVGA
jgi:hypothetical protein